MRWVGGVGRPAEPRRARPVRPQCGSIDDALLWQWVCAVAGVSVTFQCGQRIQIKDYYGHPSENQ